MTAEETLVAALKAAADVTAIIGTAPMRLYPDALSQESEYPALVYERLNTIPTITIHNTIGFEQVTVRTIALDTIRNIAEDLATKTRDALLGAGFAYIDRQGGYEESLEIYMVTIDMLFSG